MSFSVCTRDCYDTCSIPSELKDGRFPLTQGSTSPKMAPAEDRPTENVPQGVVMLYKASWVKLLGWNANFLTTDETVQNYGNGSAYYSTWVDVRKV